jgi:FkbM family methyltransferase
LGFKKVFSFDETIKTFPEYLTLLWEKYYSYRQVPVDNNTQKELKNLFEDEKSLEILERIFRFREKPAYENYPLPERDFQYFPEFIRNFFKERTIHFADLGAYKGDTVAILLYLFENKVKTIIFEPVKKHLEILKGVLKEISQNGLITYLYPSGVWRETAIKKVKILGPSTHINDKEGIPTPVVKLDDTLIGSPVNFLKMDIEGSELDALKGGREFIKKNRPVMAVSVYHNPRDLWEIPFFIKKEFPFYTFRLRLHGHMLNEIVLYCLPNNK